MAEQAQQELSIPGKTREGQVVSFAEDRALIQRAFRNRWIKNVNRMDELLDQCERDVQNLREGEALVDPFQLAELQIALTKTAALVVDRLKDAKDDGQPKQGGINIGTMNVQYNEIEQMTDDELDANIAEQKRILGES